MSTGFAISPHDLVRLSRPRELQTDSPIPPWVEEALQRNPWAVVRRADIDGEHVAIGIRGSRRSERFAAVVVKSNIVERRLPEDLVSVGVDDHRRTIVPALLAFSRVAPFLSNEGYRWGPGGSVAFELATGSPTATLQSDLDVIVRRRRRFERKAAGALLDALAKLSAPARVDVLLETPCGGVVLAELVRSPRRVLARTAHGPRLCADPWANDEAP